MVPSIEIAMSENYENVDNKSYGSQLKPKKYQQTIMCVAFLRNIALNMWKIINAKSNECFMKYLNRTTPMEEDMCII